MARYSFLIAALAATTSATNLYVASYAGTVTSLSLSTTDNKTYSLTNTSTSTGCGGSPTWLELDKANGVLYCLDEGNTTPNGSINTLKTSANGSLTQISHHDTITGPVASIFYNTGNKSAVALAHYEGHAISTWLRTPTGQLTYLQNLTFTVNQTGPVASRQDNAYEHEAITDPSGQYLLFPDLGADRVRVYSFDPATSLLQAHTPLVADPGSGPRHAVFWSPNNASYGRHHFVRQNESLYMFLIHELNNKISSYSVTYPPSGGMSFTKVQDVSTFGNFTTPVGAAAAEIIKSPDNKFILSSNRNDTSFNITNWDPSNKTMVASDSLAVWRPTPSGTLVFEQLAPAGGSYPRQFSMNKAGTLVSVGLQQSSEVVIYSRNPRSGLLGKMVASVPVGGQITYVMWDE